MVGMEKSLALTPNKTCCFTKIAYRKSLSIIRALFPLRYRLTFHTLLRRRGFITVLKYGTGCHGNIPQNLLSRGKVVSCWAGIQLIMVCRFRE